MQIQIIHNNSAFMLISRHVFKIKNSSIYLERQMHSLPQERHWQTRKYPTTSGPFRKNDYRRDSSGTAMLQDLKWQPLADRRRDQRLILLCKIIDGLVAIPADQHIQPNLRPSRNRHTKTLLIHTCNTDIYKHSLIPRSTIDWNSLPEDTVTSKTVDRLKAALLKRD